MDSVIDLCSSSDEDEASLLSDVSLATQRGQGDAYSEVKSSSLPEDGAVTSSSGAVVTPVPAKVKSEMAVAGGQGGDASSGVPAPCKKKARMFVGDCVEVRNICAPKRVLP